MEYDPKKVICSCGRVTCGDVAQAVKNGAKTLEDVREATRATAFCGSCTDRVEEFLGQLLSGEAVPAAQSPAPAVSPADLPAALVRKVCDDLFYVGASDHRIALFENQYPVPDGMAYNSYVLLDKKTVLFDTADQSVSEVFLRNVEAALNGRKLDYVVVHHMEPDHGATLGAVLKKWPEAQVICTAGAKKMIGQFFGADAAARAQEVRDGVSVMTGAHILSFHTAPMVHWPEVMVTYDRTSETLFSADAFGTFGALNGNLFADTGDFPVSEYRRYYSNIVGKFGPQVQAALNKLSALKISRICPLHGPVFRQDLDEILEKYRLWSTYEPEEKGVVIAYASVYGHTANACFALADALSERGVRDVRLFDVSKTDGSYILSEVFRRSHLVLASVTYAGGLFPAMESLILELKNHGLKNRTVALMENGTWAPVSGKKMTELLTGVPVTLLEQKVTLLSAMKESHRPALEALADTLAAGIVG